MSMQIDSTILARRTAILNEMGVGPLWVRRDIVGEIVDDVAPAAEAAPIATIAPQRQAPVKTPAPSMKSAKPADDAAWDDGALQSGAVPVKTVLTFCTSLDVANTARYLFAARASSVQGSEELFANILSALGLRKESSEQGELAGLDDQLKRLTAQRPSALNAMGPAIALQLAGEGPDDAAAAGNDSARFESLRGRLHRAAGELPLLVTYDAAHLLRRPADKRGAWDDLCLLMHHLKRAQATDAADSK